MTLEELAAFAPRSQPLKVPGWTLGCFHRRCITYATGREDATTLVVWIQSHGLTGDIRIPAWQPKDRLDALSPADIALAASVEGGVADTAWDGERMSWSNWAAFQPYDKWPEPGVLRRVGACLIETAPSGIYVEDWRLQPGSSGLVAGLRLVSQTVAGVERPRDGGLVVCGRHALFTLARRNPLAEGVPAQVQLAERPDLLDDVFDAEASYAVHGVVAASTHPWTVGAALPLGDFEDAGDGLVRETLADGARLWRVDTLLPDVEIDARTPAEAGGGAWLDREASTLLRS